MDMIFNLYFPYFINFWVFQWELQMNNNKWSTFRHFVISASKSLFLYRLSLYNFVYYYSLQNMQVFSIKIPSKFIREIINHDKFLLFPVWLQPGCKIVTFKFSAVRQAVSTAPAWHHTKTPGQHNFGK